MNKNEGNLSMGNQQNGSVSSNQNGSRGRVSGNGESNGRAVGTSLNGDAARRKRKSSEKVGANRIELSYLYLFILAIEANIK